VSPDPATTASPAGPSQQRARRIELGSYSDPFAMVGDSRAAAAVPSPLAPLPLPCLGAAASCAAADRSCVLSLYTTPCSLAWKASVTRPPARCERPGGAAFPLEEARRPFTRSPRRRDRSWCLLVAPQRQLPHGQIARAAAAYLSGQVTGGNGPCASQHRRRVAGCEANSRPWGLTPVPLVLASRADQAPPGAPMGG